MDPKFLRRRRNVHFRMGFNLKTIVDAQGIRFIDGSYEQEQVPLQHKGSSPVV